MRFVLAFTDAKFPTFSRNYWVLACSNGWFWLFCGNGWTINMSLKELRSSNPMLQFSMHLVEL